VNDLVIYLGLARIGRPGLPALWGAGLLHYNSGENGFGQANTPRQTWTPLEPTTANYRVGIGSDTHRLEAGGPLRLGGVSIQHDQQAVGHSDADVLLHAMIDALLGAVSMGDIGDLFPNTDPANRGRDSASMVTAVLNRLRGQNWRIVNVDCIVMLERPKLGRHKDAMRMRIAELLEIPAHNVGLKAKTGEGVDAVGRGEAVAAQCVALLERTASPEIE
jgi:2-C-methyl-D-erythritol 2,4-cyclodiphosphate synthase